MNAEPTAQEYFEKLLIQYGQRMPPNYAGFYTDISKWINAGFPPRDLCTIFAEHYKAISTKKADFENENANGEQIKQRYKALREQQYQRGQEIDIAKGAVDDELFSYLVMHHKYKLIVMCINRLPAELKEYIPQLMGEPYGSELVDTLLNLRK